VISFSLFVISFFKIFFNFFHLFNYLNIYCLAFYLLKLFRWIRFCWFIFLNSLLLFKFKFRQLKMESVISLSLVFLLLFNISLWFSFIFIIIILTGLSLFYGWLIRVLVFEWIRKSKLSFIFNLWFCFGVFL